MTINESPAPLWAQYGEDIAQQLFVLGFVCSKLKDLPLGNLSLFFLGGCLTSFCLAYTIQIATSTEYKQVESDTFWNYSFLYGLTATIGAALCVTVLMNPSLSLIGLWLFSFNHLLWYAAESNRRTYPTFFLSNPVISKRTSIMSSGYLSLLYPQPFRVLWQFYSPILVQALS